MGGKTCHLKRLTPRMAANIYLALNQQELTKIFFNHEEVNNYGTRDVITLTT